MGPPPENNIRPVTPDTPLRAGEIAITTEQEMVLSSMHRGDRRAFLAMWQTSNPRRARKIRARLMRGAQRRAGK